MQLPIYSSEALCQSTNRPTQQKQHLAKSDRPKAQDTHKNLEMPNHAEFIITI